MVKFIRLILFPLAYLKQFGRCIVRLFRKPIPETISEHETLVRAIVSPFFYSVSKKKLKPEAFLPKSVNDGVSLLRLEYTDEHFCKEHAAGLNLTQQTYQGLGTVKLKFVNDLNNNKELDQKASIKSTPLDAQLNYITHKNVYRNSPGYPMHADLYYDVTHVGEVQTKRRQYAKKLAELAVFHLDPLPNQAGWTGAKLVIQ